MMIFVGAVLNSAFYVAGVLVTALWRHDVAAADLAVVTFGVTYLSYLAQATDGLRTYAPFLVYSSIVVGLAAGLALLVGF